VKMKSWISWMAVFCQTAGNVLNLVKINNSTTDN
jgi:hypothetical protein